MATENKVTIRLSKDFCTVLSTLALRAVDMRDEAAAGALAKLFDRAAEQGSLELDPKLLDGIHTPYDPTSRTGGWASRGAERKLAALLNETLKPNPPTDPNT